MHKTAEIPQLQFIEGRRHPRHYAEADPHGPCDQEIPLLLDTVVDVPVVKVVPAEYGKFLFFWKMTSGMVSVFSAIWFDNGYMTVSVFEAGFSGDSAPRAVFLRVFVAVHKTTDFPQLQFFTVVDIPFVAQTQILMVQTIQPFLGLQLQYVSWLSMSLLCLSCRFSRAAVEKTLSSHSAAR